MSNADYSEDRRKALADYGKEYRKTHPDVRTYQERKACRRLRLTNTYSRMLQRITGRGCPRATERYKGLYILPQAEFMGWAESDPTFNALFDAWIASGYKRGLSPSIDRIDSSKGYEVSNMQWLTLSENASKAKTPRYVASIV